MNKNLDEIVEYRGVTDLVIAEVLTDNNKEGEGYTTGEVIELVGVGEISKTTSNSSESKYYNNMAAIVINSTGADEIKCSVSVIPQDKLAFITGQDYDEETGTLIEGERKVKYFALGYNFNISSHWTKNKSAIGYTNLPDKVFVVILAKVSIKITFLPNIFAI